MPVGMRQVPIVKKKHAYATDPSTIPRSRFEAARGPCWEWVNTANTTPKIGNVEIKPLSCGPRIFATLVSTMTNVVAMPILAGRSHLGGVGTANSLRGAAARSRQPVRSPASVTTNAGSNCHDTWLSVNVVSQEGGDRYAGADLPVAFQRRQAVCQAEYAHGDLARQVSGRRLRGKR